MSKDKYTYGIVIDGMFYSNRMERRMRVANGIYSIDMTQDDFMGSIEPADIDSAIRFFRKKSKIKVVRGIAFHDMIIPENPVSFKRIPIRVIDATYDDFEEVEVAILNNGACYFLQVVSTEKAFPLMDIQNILGGEDGSVEDVKGVTPEMRITYTFHVIEGERQRRLEELAHLELLQDEARERHRREMLVPVNAIRRALEESGANVDGIKKVNLGFEVTWSAAGHTINTLLDNNYRVVEGGFCMSGYDDTQSITSVSRVLQDYVDQGDYIHKTRSLR